MIRFICATFLSYSQLDVIETFKCSSETKMEQQEAEKKIFDWVKSFSSKYATANVVIEQFSGEKLGYMADHFLLKISTEDSKVFSRFFVKTFPNTYKILQKYVEQANLFEKEIFIYNTLFKQFEKYLAFLELDYAPKFFHSIDNEIVILQDLTDEGYKISKTFDEAHIRLTLEAIAKFHGDALALERFKSEDIGKSYRLNDDFEKELRDGLNRKEEDFVGYKYISAAHKGLLYILEYCELNRSNKNEFRRKLEETYEDIFVKMGTSKEFTNVCCHGDLWAKNIMFSYDSDQRPKTCKLVDFQLNRYTPPAYDLLFFLLHSTGDAHLWNDHFQQYYAFLKARLASHAIDIGSLLTFEELQDSCRYMLPPMRLKYVYHVMITAANSSRYMMEVYSDPGLYESLYEDWSGMVKRVFGESEVYRGRVLGEIEKLESLFLMDG